jgi:hypothetical protein
MAVSLALIAMKILPVVPGHFTHAEWIALALWLAIGTLLRVAAALTQPSPRA